MEETSGLLPYWERLAVMDDRTRPVHRALHGVIKPADDPFWDEHYPPDGFNCRCTVIARLDMPEDYNAEKPNEETTVAYDENGQPWKAEVVGEKISVVDLTAVQFNGIPRIAKLDEVLNRNAVKMEKSRADKPIQFTDFEKADRWAKKQFASAKYSKKEIDSLTGYAGFNSQDVNEYLRTGSVSRPDVASVNQIRDDIKNLDRAISKSKTPEENLIVYRGIGIDKSMINRIRVGGELEELGYLSTTLVPKIAKYFAERERGNGKVPCVIKIHVSKSNAAYLQPFSTLVEAELLFARGSKLHIMSVMIRKDGSLYVSGKLQK